MKRAKTLLICLVIVGLFCPGCKKESPPAEEPNAAVATPKDDDASKKESAPAVESKTTVTSEQGENIKEKEFLSDTDAVVAKLEDTTISKLDIPKNKWPSFVRRMERANKEGLRKAELTICSRQFKILLGESLERDFFLYDAQRGVGPYWWGSWSLHSYHKIDDEYFEFMLVEDGTKIAGRPYKGELGVIKVGKGGRDIEKAEFRGSVHQARSVAAPIGLIEQNWPTAVSECKIPVGDYTAYIMDVTYDNLSVSISNNYHTNAQGIKSFDDVVYGMQLCKDKPYMLDFSNKPMVIFDEPSMKNTSFSRGQEIKFAAVLVDPELDIMIRRLNDTSVQVEQETSTGYKYKRPKSLDPKVVIKRDNGEVVAEGVMPFG